MRLIPSFIHGPRIVSITYRIAVLGVLLALAPALTGCQRAAGLDSSYCAEGDRTECSATLLAVDTPLESSPVGNTRSDEPQKGELKELALGALEACAETQELQDCEARASKLLERFRSKNPDRQIPEAAPKRLAAKCLVIKFHNDKIEDDRCADGVEPLHELVKRRIQAQRQKQGQNAGPSGTFQPSAYTEL